MCPTYEETLKYIQLQFEGVTDAGGVPYWEHCKRVADRVDDPMEKLAGLLHDVVEDTEVTLNDLRALGYPDTVVEIVNLLTRDRASGQTYMNWIRSIIATGNRGAMRVKLADNEDNSDPDRIQSLPPEKRSIQTRYHRSMRLLRTALSLPETNHCS